MPTIYTVFIIPRIVLLASIQPKAETLDFSTYAIPRNLLKIFPPHEYKPKWAIKTKTDNEGTKSPNGNQAFKKTTEKARVLKQEFCFKIKKVYSSLKMNVKYAHLCTARVKFRLGNIFPENLVLGQKIETRKPYSYQASFHEL